MVMSQTAAAAASPNDLRALDETMDAIVRPGGIAAGATGGARG